MAKSEYYGRLSGAVKTRYDLKTECIRGLDPYFLKTGFTSNMSGLPPITYNHIQYYLVVKTSFYSNKQFGANKSMLAENFLASEKISRLQMRKIGDYFLVRGNVAPSMKTKEALRQAWTIVYKAGIVESGHCTCMAGLGECCSHVAALLFAMLHLREQACITSVTERAAYWKIPAQHQKAPMRPIKDIDFGTPRSIIMKKRTGETPLPPTNISPKYPTPDQAQLQDMLTKIAEVGQVDCCTHLVLPPFSAKFEKTSAGLPPSLRSLYKSENETKTLDELRKLGRETNIDVTLEQIKVIFQKTKEQAKKRVWFTMKEGRPGASLLHSICHTNLENPAYSIVKKVVNPYQCRFHSAATKYGCTHEKDALKAYITLMKKEHINFSCEESGWIINPIYIEVGATPDGLVNCDCCGSGCVEIKCPFCWENLTMNEIEADLERGLARQCLLQTLNEETGDFNYKLKEQHQYYYQVQQQMFVAEKKYCDFVVWNENAIICDRVYPNEDFWQEKYSTVKTFFYDVIMPELLGKHYSKIHLEKQREESKRCSTAPQSVKKKAKQKRTKKVTEEVTAVTQPLRVIQMNHQSVPRTNQMQSTHRHPSHATRPGQTLVRYVHTLQSPLVLASSPSSTPLRVAGPARTPVTALRLLQNPSDLSSPPSRTPLRVAGPAQTPVTALRLLQNPSDLSSPPSSTPIRVAGPTQTPVRVVHLLQTPSALSSSPNNTPIRVSSSSNILHIPAKPRSTFYQRLLIE